MPADNTCFGLPERLKSHLRDDEAFYVLEDESALAGRSAVPYCPFPALDTQAI